MFAFLSCLNPGDEIIVPEPAYANYMAFAISAGAVIRTVTTTIEEGFSLPKVEKFEELINERTKAILICNPNNPTGYLYTRRVPLAEWEGRADRYSGDTHELLSVWQHRPMEPASGSGKRAFRLLFVRCWALLFYIYSFLNGKDRYFS